MRKHVFPEKELDLPRTLHNDRHRLEEVDVPIVTVSASFRSEIKKHLGEHAKDRGEIVFSRAHYSMAVAVLEQAKRQKLSAWMIDPINYLSWHDWRRIERIEKVGHLAARTPILKTLKNIFDTFVRNKVPLSDPISKPLDYLTARTKKTIISLHYEAGNLLARQNRQVLQVVTDPQIRPHYLFEAHNPCINFAVFDEQTQNSFFAKARALGKVLPDNKVVVTGPPVDPRIMAKRFSKKPGNYKKRQLRLVITTSGLGTNYGEIKRVLENLLPVLKTLNMQLLLYASTHKDFRQMFYALCLENGLPVGDETADTLVRVIYDKSIIVSNQKLIDYAFGWADGFITKPSGDMAYDAAAAGCFLLTLDPWGEWEEKIYEIFNRKQIAVKADIDNIVAQIDQLRGKWFEHAIKSALGIDKLYLAGAKNIIDLQQALTYNE